MSKNIKNNISLKDSLAKNIARKAMEKTMNDESMVFTSDL
jgi:hypothetical protein